ncbi:MAG: DUF4276 family protein [Chloroflexota bacterium]|nr:DUF4276 family protein [Chloroflexota bacterium]MDE2947719.1 DUF4276 family protein [Chloroflexota bacterium]
MTSVYVICEGGTESTVVKNIFAPDFAAKGVYLCPIRIGQRRRGGNVTFDRLALNIRDQLHNNRNCYCTTFVDFYGIDVDFPGKQEAARKSSLSDKQGVVCDAFVDKLAETLDEGPMRRFIPYVQMHEFEGLLFSDPDQLAHALGRQDSIQQFRAIRHDFDTPEHIDDSPESAPSKRIQKIFPRYRKVQMGQRAARAITLKKIRQECPLFNAWLAKLESLPPLPA